MNGREHEEAGAKCGSDANADQKKLVVRRSVGEERTARESSAGNVGQIFSGQMFRTRAERVDGQRRGVEVEQSLRHEVVQPLQPAVAAERVVQDVERPDVGPVRHVLVDLGQVHVAQDEVQLRKILVFRNDGQGFLFEFLQPSITAEDDRFQGPILRERVRSDSDQVRRVGEVDGRQHRKSG